ncbi:MAG: glutamate racemase [Elusimicrobiota bacterium]
MVRKKITRQPIGIFDSGMGGLTVFQAVSNLLPGEDIIYFGDTAHLPYGNKSKETVIKYSRGAVEFFKNNNVKFVVVACNTASVYALDILKKVTDFPVIGVVNPGVEAALRTDTNSIGIIGTYGTIKSGIYQKKLKVKNPELKIYSRACPLFVPLVEEGWVNHHVTREVARIYLDKFKNNIQALILACTHYPLLKNIITEVVGKSTRVIDSARVVAEKVKNNLKESNLLQSRSEKEANYQFYVSDAPDLFGKRGSIFLEHPINDVKKIDID